MRIRRFPRSFRTVVSIVCVSVGFATCATRVVASDIFSPWDTAFHHTSGGNAGAGGGQPSPIVDPLGDAFDTFGAGPPLLDIDTVDVTFNGTDLLFSMTFHTPIAPPSAGGANALVGVLEFDVDQSTATGVPPVQTAFSPPFTFLTTGVDFLLNLFSEVDHPGTVDLVETATGFPVGQVPVTYSPTGIVGSVPLSLLSDDGVVDFTSTIGTVPQPTDALEVVGFSVPEPATVLLLGVATVFLGARHRRREQQ